MMFRGYDSFRKAETNRTPGCGMQRRWRKTRGIGPCTARELYENILYANGVKSQSTGSRGFASAPCVNDE